MESIKGFSLFEQDGVSFRFPTLLSHEGNLIAVADVSPAGAPNRVGKAVRFRLDGENRWSNSALAVGEYGNTKTRLPHSLLYDRDGHTLFLLYTRLPANVSPYNCAQSCGVEGDAVVLRQGLNKFLLKDGQIFTARGKRTQYSVDEEGNLSHNQGNIWDGTGKFKIESTAFLFLTKSTDGGESWSAPVCLNRMVKKPDFGFLGAASGVGLQIRHGEYAGRLIFPVYYGAYRFPPNFSNCVIYSDDGGKTWELGNPPAVPLKYGVRNPKLMTYRDWMTESQLVEADGNLFNFIVNQNKNRVIATAVSTDGGVNFSDFTYRTDLPHGEGSFAATSFRTEDGKEAIATLNADPVTKEGVLRLSFDVGKTFQFTYTFHTGDFSAPAVAYLSEPNGDTVEEKISVAYGSPDDGRILYTEIPLKEIMQE